MTEIRTPGESPPSDMTSAMTNRKFMTIPETAEILNISTRTVRRLIDRKLLRTCYALRKVMIPTIDVETFVTRTCPGLEADPR
jgi:excisionase family DNA binding protein